MVEETVVVTGAGGMLGHDVLEALSEAGLRGIGFEREALDITDDAVGRLADHNPSAIINCAAYTDVDGAEVEREKCRAVNVEGVGKLASLCSENDILLVQISTDYVFDGKRRGYDEDDPTNPVNYYGKTKEEAERLVRDVPRHLIIRTAWLYGKNGRNFVETILEKTRSEKTLKVVNDQHGSPTYTKDLAGAMVGMLDRAPGAYHLTNAGVCTWYEFAREIVRLSGAATEIVPVPAAAYRRVAKRPRYSILNNNKTEKMRRWEEALKEYMEER